MQGFYHSVCAVCVIIILSVVAPVAVIASKKLSSHRSISSTRFRTTVIEHGTTSMAGNFFGLGVRETYQPRILGAGLELTFPWSAKHGDSYAILDAMVLFGWIDLGVGASVMMTSPRAASSYVISQGILPYATIGLLIPGFKVGRGRLGFNTSLDFFITAFSKSLLSSVYSQVLTTPSSYPGSQVFGAGGAAFFTAIMTVIKLTLGLNYSFSF